MQPAPVDPRNAQILVHVSGRLLPRDEARVSVFDSAVQGGDAVWEGLRVHAGRIFRLQQHLERLERSARALAFEQIPAREELAAAVFATLQANGMREGVHVRLTLTRGLKTTSGMDPRLNRSGPTLIVLPEYKPPVWGAGGLTLITSSVRRNPPMCLDSRIHHANLLNNILAKLEANAAGADDALMLDVEGHVAETNSTNVFLVRGGALATPLAGHCLPGITRAAVLELARAAGLQAQERRVALSELHTADEVFTTGTLGGLAWVRAIDGRQLGERCGPLTARLQQLYAELTERESEPLPF